MDEPGKPDQADQRNHQIEEQYPEGKVQSGFTYSFGQLDQPKMISLEIRMSSGEVLRLFFEPEHFRDFADTAGVVSRMLEAP